MAALMSARSRRSGRVLLTTSGVTPVIAAIITLGAAIITRGIIAGWVVLLATGLLIAGVVWLVLWRLRRSVGRFRGWLRALRYFEGDGGSGAG